MNNFEFVKGDITKVIADAIVLPANSKLKEGRGVSEAIFKAAGRRRLTKACKEIGICDIGDAVPTLAYNLDAKFILHAIIPEWKDGEHNEYEMLCSAYLESLKLADEMKCATIAFPLLASGNNGFDLELALEIAIKSIENYNAKHLKEAIIVVYGSSIKKLVIEAGFDVKPLIDEKLIKKAENKMWMQKLRDEGKDEVKEILEEEIRRAFDYLKNRDGRDSTIKMAQAIVANAYKFVKKQVQATINN